MSYGVSFTTKPRRVDYQPDNANTVSLYGGLTPGCVIWQAEYPTKRLRYPKFEYIATIHTFPKSTRPDKPEEIEVSGQSFWQGEEVEDGICVLTLKTVQIESTLGQFIAEQWNIHRSPIAVDRQSSIVTFDQDRGYHNRDTYNVYSLYGFNHLESNGVDILALIEMMRAQWRL